MANALLGGFGAGYNFGKGIADDAVKARKLNAFADLASQAYQADGPAQNALVSQAVAISPEDGMALGKQLQVSDEQREKGLINAARMLTGVPLQHRDGVYQRMRPALERRYGLTGLPATYDEQVDSIANQLAALGGVEDNTPADIRTLQALRDNPELAELDMKRRQATFGRPQLVETEQGYYWATPGGEASPVRPAGQPASGFQGGTIDTGDGVMTAPAGGFSVDAIIAAEQQRALDAGEPPLSPREVASLRSAYLESNPSALQAGGGTSSGILRPPSKPVDQIRTLAPEELTSYGLQPGTVAQMDSAGRISVVSKPAEPDKPKQMPVGALRMVQDAREGLAVARGVNQSLSRIQGQLAAGQLDLGPIQNWISRGRNAAGMSSEESRNYQLMMSSLEKLRNDTLRLNKGVQTEGDAQRAWNELLANVNDEQAVMDQLDRLMEINRRAEQLQMENLQYVESNYRAGTGPASPDTSDGYRVGQVLEVGGKRYRVTGGDPNDPDLEEVP